MVESTVQQFVGDEVSVRLDCECERYSFEDKKRRIEDGKVSFFDYCAGL